MNRTYTQTDLVEGSGAMATSGKTATVNYTGWLYSESEADNKGTQFDSSMGRGPFAFRLGAGQVIRGWEQGVQRMKVGGQRRLVLPPDFAYGARGAGGVIPPRGRAVQPVIRDVFWKPGHVRRRVRRTAASCGSD